MSSIIMHPELVGLVTFGAPKVVNWTVASAIGCPAQCHIVKCDLAVLWLQVGVSVARL